MFVESTNQAGPSDPSTTAQKPQFIDIENNFESQLIEEGVEEYLFNDASKIEDL